MSWIEEAENKVAEGLVKLANQGSVPAASAVLKLLKEQKEATASEVHRKKMDSLKEDAVALCQYLGELGQSPASVANVIGRPMSSEESDSHKKGELERVIEIRAVELNAVRAGAGKVENWMKVVK